MPSLATPLASVIGVRVRRERQARSWTLDQCARISGVSRRMLVSIEQGEANPSIGTLLKLSDALGVGLPALVEPPAQSPIRVTRRGDGAVLWQGAAGGLAQLVAGTTAPDVVELWDWTLGPGDEHRSDPHTTGTHELIHVLEGTITVECGDESAELSVGDAMSFPGDLSHAYINTSGAAARFALTVFEPNVGVIASPPRTEIGHA